MDGYDDGYLIYFLTDMRYVKIGYTHSGIKALVNRCITHQEGNPYSLKILGVIRGGYKEEQELHLAFTDLHCNGEWFELTVETEKYCRAARDHELTDKANLTFKQHLAIKAEVRRQKLQYTRDRLNEKTST